ncbi:MAG: Gram-negative bacterial tonB protein [Gammaproteobacteria bacterium]|nr:Gram-negative bacterial tonB protein [Gammaproteobacteria bacterium]
MFSGKRGVALLVVILLHVIVGWAFYTGLASRLAQTIIPPVEIAQIDKPKDVDKPPPPPPKLEEIKPYVPPPEFVDIQAPQEQTNAIAVVTQTQQPTPAPVAAPPPPAPKASTSIKMDPKHPLKIGEEYYPDASKRANEEGRCTVQVTVSADGRITSESIQASSGFPRLDEACLKGVHGQRVIPATEDGKPVEKTVSIPIVWKLTNK